MDREALADALYAERLAAPIRDRAFFVKSKPNLNEEGINLTMGRRGEAIRSELSGTSADVEWALNRVETEWIRYGFARLPQRIVSVFSRVARHLLQPAGRDMVLRVDHLEPDCPEPGREILRWRFISLALPPGILIAAATPSGWTPPTTVRLLDRSIAPDHPVAQHHVHHAAMMSFEDLWSSLRLRALLWPAMLAAGLRDARAFCPGLHPGICFGGKSDAEKRRAERYPFRRLEHMAEWGDVIRQALIAGRVLDRHSHHRGALDNCKDSDCTTIVETTLRTFLAGRTKRYAQTPTPYPWPDELISLERRRRYRSSHAGGTDFVQQLTAEERSFLARSFERLRPDDVESSDPLYEALFAQYLRVKAAVFGLLVQAPGDRGLTKFLEYFQQIKVYAGESDLLDPRLPREPGLSVRATEYRIAPDAWFKIVGREDRETEKEATADPADHESAWLIHFKREAHNKYIPLYAAAISQMEREADRIMRTLDEKPIRLNILRGIDICGVEEAQPLWVCADTLRRVRAHSRVVAARRPGLRLDPLRLTLHAGEDFNWLTSGIRAIAEPFQWNLIRRGDRIGHGIAITLDPTAWWQQREGEVIAVKTFDRLLDLAFLAVYSDTPTTDQESWLLAEINPLLNYIWPRRNGRGAPQYDPVYQAKELWCALGGRWMRTLLQTPHWPKNDDRPHEGWLCSYLWSRSTQDRANKEIRITVGDDRHGLPITTARNERDLLMSARRHLIRKMALWQVCIESNPTSNFLVGGLGSMVAQDFLHQRPTRAATRGDDTLTWTISTDDPITFSTTLADEYAYAWAGMVLRKEKPYDPAYARALLDEAAETSMRMRFTGAHRDLDLTVRHRRRDGGRVRHN